MRLIYSTHPSQDQARQTAEALLERGLAACCNILGQAESHYVWKGKREQAAEVVMLSKVPDANAPAAMDAIRAQHPYDCPAILELPVAGGDPDFLAWVEEAGKPHSA